MKLEDLQPTAAVRGIIPDAFATVISVQWFGSEALELTYKTPTGRWRTNCSTATTSLASRSSSRAAMELRRRRRAFRLVSEAQRIRLAHLFDPVLAVHTSVVEPLPHQITAVYESMLPRQPLRFLLADDPGAGKTIMAGLLIKELIARGDLQRCFIVCPGSLAEQWQDELFNRFQLPFEILTNDKLEAARSRPSRSGHDAALHAPESVSTRCGDCAARTFGTQPPGSRGGGGRSPNREVM